MKKTLVIGAHGQIGQLIVRLLAQNKLPVKAMVRNPEQLTLFENLDVETVLADLEEDFSAVFTGCNKVIFTAGSGAATGADKTLLVDLWGAIKSIDFSQAQDIKHFIMVSSFNSHNPDTGPVAIKPYLVAKFAADEYLKNSGLPYTILRPARLTNEKATGKIRTDRPEAPEERIIPRADVAAAACYCIKHDESRGQIINLCQGDKLLASELASVSN